MRNGGKQCTMSANVSVMAPVCQGGHILYCLGQKTPIVWLKMSDHFFWDFLEHFKPIFRCIDCLERNDPPPPLPLQKVLEPSLTTCVQRFRDHLVVLCAYTVGWGRDGCYQLVSATNRHGPIYFFPHKNGMIEFRRLRIYFFLARP